MKNLLLFIFITSIYFCNGQNATGFEYSNFENQFLNYEPTKKTQVSKTDFDYALIIIQETKSGTKNNPENFSSSDYFNILSAFLTLKESEENIKMVFQKFETAEGSCDLSMYIEKKVEKNPKYDIIRKDYIRQLEQCKANKIQEKTFDIAEYSKTNNLNLNLIKKINNISLDDKAYRNKSNDENSSEQRKLDIQNQHAIDSLFKVHKTYIGRTIVGEKFESVMWSVIQHSNIEMMTEYLPIIQKAVKENELSVVPFKMLIDRLYGLKYGYQIFGSQNGFGFELADDEKRKEIKLKYDIK